MAKLKNEEVFKYPVLSSKEFSDLHGGITSQALTYLRNNDIIDFVRVGMYNFIVMTEKSKSYNPKANINRV